MIDSSAPRTVMTVTGPLSVDNLGVILPHEHLLANTVREYRGAGLLNDIDLAIEELGAFFRTGGRTLVDLTTSELGRDPRALRQISTASRVAIIMGCGHYRDPYLDRGWFDEHSADAIAEVMIKEIRDGVGDTGIRPGIIGEIGCDREVVSAAEERSFRAAARAHLATGLTISTHAARWPVGRLQAQILEQEGVAPHRVIIGHCDTVPDRDYHLEMAQRGYFVQFDGFSSEDRRDVEFSVDSIVKLKEHGQLSRVLISQDVFLRSHLSAHGGGGYARLATTILPMLRETGLSDGDIEELTVKTPARALTGML